MCGRYAIFATPHKLKDLFGTDNILNLPPRYNAAPQQELPIIGHNRQGARMGLARWGWGPDNFFNARSETVAEKPAFREAWMRKRRCLIPADGFYEWHADADGKKQPYFIHAPDRACFALAGLWTQRPEGVTFTILTKAADGAIKDLHERMPVIVPPEKYTDWFTGDAQGIITQASGAHLIYHPVDAAVGKVANDADSLIQPLRERA